MSNDFFGGFDFNGDGHISGFERTTGINYIDSMSNGYSGSGSRYSRLGSYTRSGTYSGSVSRTGSNSRCRVNTRAYKADFCNIYGGYYACRKNGI